VKKPNNYRDYHLQAFEFRYYWRFRHCERHKMYYLKRKPYCRIDKRWRSNLTVYERSWKAHNLQNAWLISYGSYNINNSSLIMGMNVFIYQLGSTSTERSNIKLFPEKSNINN
jgi:hypothetical protein